MNFGTKLKSPGPWTCNDCKCSALVLFVTRFDILESCKFFRFFIQTCFLLLLLHTQGLFLQEVSMYRLFCISQSFVDVSSSSENRFSSSSSPPISVQTIFKGFLEVLNFLEISRLEMLPPLTSVVNIPPQKNSTYE